MDFKIRGWSSHPGECKIIKKRGVLHVGLGIGLELGGVNRVRAGGEHVIMSKIITLTETKN